MCWGGSREAALLAARAGGRAGTWLALLLRRTRLVGRGGVQAAGSSALCPRSRIPASSAAGDRGRGPPWGRDRATGTKGGGHTGGRSATLPRLQIVLELAGRAPKLTRAGGRGIGETGRGAVAGGLGSRRGAQAAWAGTRRAPMRPDRARARRPSGRLVGGRDEGQARWLTRVVTTVGAGTSRGPSGFPGRALGPVHDRWQGQGTRDRGSGPRAGERPRPRMWASTTTGGREVRRESPESSRWGTVVESISRARP